MNQPETKVPHQKSRVAILAAFFRNRANVWIDGRELEIAGRYAWRTRVSDLRRPPWNMRIVNRQRHLRVDDHTITVSEYKFQPEEIRTTARAQQERVQPSLLQM